MFRCDYLSHIFTAPNTLESTYRYKKESIINQPLTARTEVPENRVAAPRLTNNKQCQLPKEQT
jgi:hypothetical protein